MSASSKEDSALRASVSRNLLIVAFALALTDLILAETDAMVRFRAFPPFLLLTPNPTFFCFTSPSLEPSPQSRTPSLRNLAVSGTDPLVALQSVLGLNSKDPSKIMVSTFTKTSTLSFFALARLP